MARAADCGAVILPPMPAFYHRPQTIMDLIHQSLGKALEQVGIEHDLFRRWNGHRHDDAALDASAKHVDGANGGSHAAGSSS
jgi:hypothetical protein